jgi:Right handed beta helix region/Secretion system C-terminal sorting domain
MKQRITLLFLLVAAGLSAQTIFVNSGAAGLNNGTSWANAYVSLDLALAVSASSTGQEIWVAKGTYKPTAAAPNNAFFLTEGVKLYGGFAGTETNLSQRNIATNPTILSGDILGNDVAGNFTTNRTDNVQHVVIAFVSTTNNGVVLDGFTISGGHTLVGTANTDITRRGGGMLMQAKGTVRNCTFTNNYGESGAALAVLDAVTDGVLIENCNFTANNAVEDAVCFLRNTPTGLIKNCNFIGNNTKRGALYPANSVNMVIDGCLFESNVTKGTTAAPNFGAGMFTWQSTFTLNNCIFRKNKADNAAGIYIDGRDGNDLATIRGCLFENDTVTNFGGAGIYSWQANMDISTTTFRANHAPNAAGMYCDGREFDSFYSIDSCTFDGNITTSYGCSSIWAAQANFTISNSVFKNNTAPSSGAALYNSENSIFTINNCTFDNNKGNYAAAVANYGLNCVGVYDGCKFINNQATQGGGAVSNGFKANVGYINCEFRANLANFGAAIFTQNDTTQLDVVNCLFAENNATGTAGCILVNTNIPTIIEGTTFYQNIAGTGGAISATGDSALIIDRCEFVENIVTTQGAAINFSHVNATITNSLFAKNINTGAGAGGAISNNASADEVSAVTAVNCTFADNVAAIGAGIAQWEDPDATTADAKLTLLNCLFQNPDGENYTIEDGDPSVISANGNQSSDGTFQIYLLGGKDLHNTNNTFQDPDQNDYAHTIDSPASDGGESVGAPATDFLGVSRAGIPDVGYREVKTSGTFNPGLKAKPLTCSPNPAVDQTVLSFDNERTGRVQITVWNQLGQQVKSLNADKSSNLFNFTLPVNTLAAGTYKVQVRYGAVVHEGMFVKM